MLNRTVQIVCLAMIAFKTIDILERFHIALTQSWKKRFLFIRSVALPASPEVLQCRLDCVALFGCQTSPLRPLGHNAQNAKEAFDSSVAIFQHANRVVETAVRLGTDLNRHGFHLYSFPYDCRPLASIGSPGHLLLRRSRFLVVHNQDNMALLWNPESWSQRLAELEARSGDLKEAPLRRDVRSLGTLLGEVLREQAGEHLFDHVEALRQGTIARRDAEARGDDKEAERQGAKALELVHSLPPDRAILLTRAFAFYFELINLAETNHRKRRRIALQLSGAQGRQRGSLAGTLYEMRRVGISADEAMDWLRRILIVPVFTAHPTEVARRSVMFKRRRIGEFLATLDRIPVPEQDLARLEEAIRAEITSLWQTDEVRSRRPTVYDEVKMGLDYYDVSIFETLWGLYREISEALRSAYDLEIEAHELPQVLRFGSWIGGDRDGNPFVTPEVTRDAIELARGHLLQRTARSFHFPVHLGDQVLRQFHQSPSRMMAAEPEGSALQTHQAIIASSKIVASSSGPADRGESLVTRCWGKVPSTSAGMSDVV